MSTFSAKASLALWERRLRYRRRKLVQLRKLLAADERDPSLVAAVRRERYLHTEASKMVTRRRKQIAADQPLRLRALAVARSQVGIMETGGNNNGIPLSRYIRSNGGEGPEPWCGDFVAFCYRMAGSKVVQRAWAAVRSLGFLTGMSVIRVAQLLPGDIVCFTFDHTGMFVRFLRMVDGRWKECSAAQATHMETIEGNTGASGARSDSSTGGDGVYVKVRALNLVARGVRVNR